jgi:septation ring formation regulator EzrA
MLAGSDKLKTSGLLPAMREDIRKQAAVFSAYVQRASGSLAERKLAVTADIQAAEEKCGHIQADIDRAGDAIRKEQEFRAHAQERLKGLESDRTAQTAEMERTRQEAERVQVTMEINTALAGSIGASNAYLKNMNQRLEKQFEEHKQAFARVARLLRKEA